MRIKGKYRNEKDKGLQNDEKQVGPHQKSDPYPWLADDDPRRYQMKKLCMRK